MTTPCPHCGRPVVWRRRAIDRGTDELEVAARGCFCALDEDEWADLADAAAEAFDEREG